MKIRIRFTNKLFVLISIIFIRTMQYSSAQTSTAPAVGNTTVSADVGSLGNATATIPIYCPPARLGIKPSINLTFNSQGNSGVLGKGWNITGMSVITRTGRNWHLDNGVQEGITLTNNDKLALDGQRLMLIEDPLNLSTTPIPFINVNNIYRNEQDQFVKVTYRDGDYFEVDLKGGGKAFYGKISNSKHIPIGSSQTLSWYISRSYDKNGNYIEYEYDNSGGQIFLSEIRYGGYDCTLFNTKSSGWAAQGTFNKVVFTPLATSHTSQQYVAGFEIKQNKIISKIETFTNNTTLVRTYNMVYETDNISTRLTQINEQIGSSNKMHPVGITWQEDEPIDIVTRTVSGPVATNAGNNVVKKMGDFNGDGKTDILIINGELKPSKNKLLNKTNTFSFKTVSANGNLIDLPILVNNYTIYYDNLPYDNISEVLIGDVDADGDDDIIFQTLTIDYSTGQKSCGNLTFDIYILNSMTYHYNLYKSNSNFNLKTPQFDKQDNYYPPRSINFNIDFISFQNEVTEYALVIPMLVEADGDGFLDLLENETKRNRNLIEQGCEATNLGELAYNQIHIYLSTLVNEPILTNRYYNHPANIPQLVTNRIVPMDFNGNGKTDFMFSFEQSNTTSIFEYNNETKAFKHIYGTGQYGFPTKWHKFIQTGDFNGDGKTDLLYFVNDNWMIAYSTGIGYEEKNATNLWFSHNNNPERCYSQAYERSGFNFYIADFNGDGKDDILERHNHGTDGMNSPTHSADGLYIYYSQGLGFIKTNINENEPCNTCTNTRYSVMDNFIADFDGDGKKDILSNAHYPDADHVLLERFNQFNYKLNKIKYSDKHSYEFTYAPLTQCASYQRTNFDYNKNGKAISIKPAMYVVESMKINNSLLDKTSNYYYKDLLYHKHGRGLLGFAKTAVTISNADPNKITTIVNNYRQNILPNYVYKLDLFETITYRTNDGTGWGGIDETSRKIFTYRIINTTKFNSNVFFEYNSFLVETNNVNGTRKVTCFEYDTDGNLTYTLETYDMMGNMGNPVFTKTSNYQYATYNSWLPSSMIKSRVCQIRYNGSAPYYAQNEMGYNMMGDLTHTEHLKNNLKYYYKELFGYDNYGNIVKSSLDSANNTSTNTFRTKLFEYDNGRFLKKTYNALGHISQFVYEPIYGNKISETGIDGLSTTYQYDVWGRLIQTNNPNNTQENISYDWSTNNGHNEYYSITKSNSLGNLSHEYYDALDRKVLATSFGFKEAEATQHWVYNSDNQLAQQSNAYDATDVSNTPILTDYAYDNYNRPVSVKYNNVEMSNTSYRVLPVGYETTIITYIDIDLIDKKEVKKTTTLDPTDLTIIATDKGGTITYKYGSHNKLLETTSNGSTIYLTYNTQLNKISMTDPNTGTLLYDYNAFGELLGQTNAKGNDYSYSYDDLGRMTKKWGGQEVYTYTYNNTTGAAGIGQIHEEELKINGTSKHKKTHSYNAYGLLIGVCEVVNGIPYNTNYSYDNYFRTTVIDYPNISIRHHYYDHNNLEKITYANDSNNIIWQKTAEEIDGKPKTEIYGNGFENNYTYDAHRQLHTIQSINAGTQQTALDVEYNFELTSGNLMWRKYGSTSTNATTETFRYDQSDRLISIVEDNPIGRAANKVFEYEPNGNTKNITYNGLVQKLEYNNPKMPHALTDHKFDNTNPTVPMSSIDIHDYIYNRFDKIEDIKQDYGKYTMHIEYGIDQQRISMELVEYSDIVRRYYIGSANMETKEVNDVEYENTYIYADGKPIAIHSLVYAPESQTEELYYLHTDYQGSLMAITKSNGYVSEYRNYDAWGRPRDCWTWDYSSGYFSYVGAATGLTLRGYTMHEHLEMFSLINMNGRLYDPVLGRMLSPDNYVQSPDNTQSFNRYSYCVNNPMKYTDPSGQWFGGDDAVVAGIGFAIGYLGHGITTGDWGKGAVIAGIGGAAMAWVGYNTCGIATAGQGFSGVAGTNALKFAGNYAINSTIASFMPSMNVSLGNNVSLSVSPSIMFGSHSFTGASVGISYSDEDFSVGIGLGGGYGANGWGGTKGWMGNASWGASANFDGGWSASFGQSVFMGSNRQMTGRIGVGYNGFSFYYENDHFKGFGDGNDRWRTASASLNYKGEYGDYGVGTNIYTNEAPGGMDRENKLMSKEGKDHYLSGAKGIEGLAYFRAGNYYAGYRSAGIGHFFQNKVAHDKMGLPRWNWDWRAMNRPLLMYKSHNSYSNW